jgi:NTE family protein
MTVTPFTRTQPPRTAFVLSGGASLGALQVGMLRALYERGIAPDLLVGTSAGAINAAYVASRPQTVATAGELARVWRGLHRDDLFPVSPRTVIGGLTNHRDRLVPDRGLRQLARRHLRIERVEHTTVPLHIVAFDVLSSQDVLLSDGPMLEAVLAAAAIPGVFPPVPSGDRLLVDGGVRNNTPISHAIELGAERIYVRPTADPCARTLPVPPRGALDAAVHAFALLLGARLESDLARYATAVELRVQSRARSPFPTRRWERRASSRCASVPAERSPARMRNIACHAIGVGMHRCHCGGATLASVPLAG